MGPQSCMNDNYFRFLLVGKTGEGKSSTGNSILGQRIFKVGADFSSISTKCETGKVKVLGRNVVVVDTPGFADPGISKEDIYKEMIGNVKLKISYFQPDGFDAILIVTRYGRKLTEEDKLVFQNLEDLLGTGYVEKHGILVVTCADCYDPEDNDDMSFETFLQQQTGVFQEIREKCNNRVVVFDNKISQKTFGSQVERLMNLAAQMGRKCGRYSGEVFKTYGRYDFKEQQRKSSWTWFLPAPLIWLLYGSLGRKH